MILPIYLRKVKKKPAHDGGNRRRAGVYWVARGPRGCNPWNAEKHLVWVENAFRHRFPVISRASTD